MDDVCIQAIIHETISIMNFVGIELQIILECNDGNLSVIRFAELQRGSELTRS